jgi:hypothetical protein
VAGDRIDRDVLLAELRQRGVVSAAAVVEPQADGRGAAYIDDPDELGRARAVLEGHPQIVRVEDGPTGLAWTLLYFVEAPRPPWRELLEGER